MTDSDASSHSSRSLTATGGLLGEYIENNSTGDSGGGEAGDIEIDNLVISTPESERTSVIPGGSQIVSSTGRTVNVSKFGKIKFKRSTDVVFGVQSVYHGPITIQQVVHDSNAVPQSDTCTRRIVNSEEFGDRVTISGRVHWRTGLVLNGRSSRNDFGDVAVTTGSSLLWKHLIGRQPRTSTWIPVALFGFILFMTITINNFVQRLFQNPVPSSQGRTVMTEDESIQRENDPAPNLSRSVVIPRSMWLAQPPKEYTPMKHPVEYVIISHTATEPCFNQTECCMQVRLVQKFHVESRNWSDVGYNFLVGGDGNAYEGRGWQYVGAHAKGYNDLSIGISFIGTFSDILPPPAQIRACKMLIKEGVRLGKVSPVYKLIGHRQVSPTESPGEKLYEELQRWEHWSHEVGQ